VIHVPGRELDGSEDGDGTATPAKKRTRRGSRGGKNRRKKPLVAGEATATELLDPELADPEADRAAELEVEIELEDEPAAEHAPEPPIEPEPEAEPEPPSENGDGEWTYTPMSQWGDSDS
jgi:hypothetical protein